MHASTDLYELALAQLQLGRPDLAEPHLTQLLRQQPSDARALLTLGQIRRQQGRQGEAVALYRDLLRVDGNHRDALYQLAGTLNELGQLDQSVQTYRELLTHFPDHIEGLTELGALLAGHGEIAVAVATLGRAIALNPQSAQARLNYAVALFLSGRLHESQGELETALRIRPNYPDAWYNLGNVLERLGNCREAEAAYRRTLELRPQHFGALTNLGLLLQKAERVADALPLLRRALALRPTASDAFNNLGFALQQARRPGEAVVMLEHALRLNPRYAEANNNLGQALFNLGRFPEAEACLRAALSEQPGNAEMHANLGAVLQAVGRFDESLACFELALLFDPQSSNAHYNRAMALLSQGKWLEGWPDYEHRLRLPGHHDRPHHQPRWDGSPLDRKTVLIWTEQGLGDAIQFVRYARLLRDRGARVVFECPPQLVGLLRSAPGIDQIVTEGDHQPEADFQIPLVSLPGLLGTTLQAAPADVPYLRAPRERIEHWRAKLGPEPTFRVGVVWRGNPRHSHDHWRSVRLELFEKLARVPGVSLVSLQQGLGREELSEIGDRFRIWHANEGISANDSDGLVDTAALMSCLDLVISVDTALAHLAGALALPTWLAVPALPDWRWLRSGERTVWYPTMRLFRQRTLGEWRPVFSRMAHDLGRLSKTSV